MRGEAMTSGDVLELYFGLQSHGIRVWIDGGWCVDALVGRQIRDHADLDLAVGRPDAEGLVACLAAEGFVPFNARQDRPGCARQNRPRGFRRGSELG